MVPATAVVEDTYAGSCTFMNWTGDITIVWDEQNREHVLEIIRKKMNEGVVFFTTKKFLFNKLSRQVKVTERNLNNIENVIIDDAQFDKMVQDMDDRDIAELVKADRVGLAKRAAKMPIKALARAKQAEDVIDKDSIAVRPVRGG